MGTPKKEKGEYNTEFKIDAGRLVEDQGYRVKETCERLGIPLSNLTRWLSQYRKGKHKQGQPTANEAELRQLREENKRLEMEVAILKKAATYKGPLAGRIMPLCLADSYNNEILPPAKGFFLRGSCREVPVCCQPSRGVPHRSDVPAIERCQEQLLRFYQKRNGRA
jgi:transposase